jgi:hypothetical protein
MNRKLIYPVLAVTLAILACNLPGKNPIQTQIPNLTASPSQNPDTTPLPGIPTDSSTVAPTWTPPTGPGSPTLTIIPQPPTNGGLTFDMLKNGTFHAPSYDRTVKLTDGSYSESSGSYNYTVTLENLYAFGDLNGDGKDDAAVIIAENGGGSGTFISLIAITNENGQAKQIGESILGDRVSVETADISSGVIHLGMKVHAPNDGLCCPSLSEKQNYWLFGKLLFLMRVTSTPADTERIVAINSPGHWSTQTNPFTVEGSVTVLPFENTLGFRIYKIDGTKINEGSVIVTPTVGTAGIFSQTFNLSSAGITDWVIIQFVDISAADGSTDALGSVILKAH